MVLYGVDSEGGNGKNEEEQDNDNRDGNVALDHLGGTRMGGVGQTVLDGNPDPQYGLGAQVTSSGEKSTESVKVRIGLGDNRIKPDLLCALALQ
ncbi:hypothetical protein N7456_009295 [Penicillium angulare]|uniref:Uncharacterized protein n=1 Tax=Penicillium angulare TaxID=116970 RepID=A0A9W9K549_9EURO|nr:hypothetical protein N7456_009295 [Penicillium angulare]